jgi:hypothetical protein
MKKFICAMALTLLGLGALSQQASAATVTSFSNTVAANTSFSKRFCVHVLGSPGRQLLCNRERECVEEPRCRYLF